MNADARISPPRSRGSRHGAPISATADGVLPGRVALTLAATSDAPALARHAAAAALADWSQERRDAALLVISELVTNAVRHGSAAPSDRVTLRVRRRGHATRIEVGDRRAQGGTPVTAQGAALDDERKRSGWGLSIVAELTDSWGVEHGREHTCVWCEIVAP